MQIVNYSDPCCIGFMNWYIKSNELKFVTNLKKLFCRSIWRNSYPYIELFDHNNSIFILMLLIFSDLLNQGNATRGPRAKNSPGVEILWRELKFEI